MTRPSTDDNISLRTMVSSVGFRLVEISSMLGGMLAYAERPIETLVGIHALHELRKMHMELGIALERFEVDNPDEVRRSRSINNREPRKADQPKPAPEASP